LQVEVGFGDAVTPEAQPEEFPTLLDLPAPILLAYPRETSIAEKFEAMVNLGLTNSRMKDYYDIWLLSEQFSFEGETLKTAITAIFKRRKTALPREAPVGLSNEFVTDAGKRAQWHAFVIRSRLDSKELSLDRVIERVAAFVMPPSIAAAERSSFELAWAKGGPWEVPLTG
jgi:hypothetical protein